MSRQDSQVNLRLPVSILEALKESAKLNGRSLNKEVAHILVQQIDKMDRISTLRDEFAKAAMQGLIASGDEGAGDRVDEVPVYAYAIADEMLAVRGAA